MIILKLLHFVNAAHLFHLLVQDGLLRLSSSDAWSSPFGGVAVLLFQVLESLSKLDLLIGVVYIAFTNATSPNILILIQLTVPSGRNLVRRAHQVVLWVKGAAVRPSVVIVLVSALKDLHEFILNHFILGLVEVFHPRQLLSMNLLLNQTVL